MSKTTTPGTRTPSGPWFTLLGKCCFQGHSLSLDHPCCTPCTRPQVRTNNRRAVRTGYLLVLSIPRCNPTLSRQDTLRTSQGTLPTSRDTLLDTLPTSQGTLPASGRCLFQALVRHPWTPTPYLPLVPMAHGTLLLALALKLASQSSLAPQLPIPTRPRCRVPMVLSRGQLVRLGPQSWAPLTCPQCLPLRLRFQRWVTAAQVCGQVPVEAHRQQQQRKLSALAAHHWLARRRWDSPSQVDNDGGPLAGHEPQLRLRLPATAIAMQGRMSEPTAPMTDKAERMLGGVRLQRTVHL